MRARLSPQHKRNEELAMPSDIGSRSETTTQIVKLARFAVLATVALAILLLLADFAGRGWSAAELRFLSERVLVAFVYGIAAEVIAAIAAVTCIALWKSSD
jgi:hypothetical protein